MAITDAESRHISVLAGEGDLPKLRAAVQALALREALSPADVLITCKDDYHQTAAHIAAKGGQARVFALSSFPGCFANVAQGQSRRSPTSSRRRRRRSFSSTCRIGSAGTGRCIRPCGMGTSRC